MGRLRVKPQFSATQLHLLKSLAGTDQPVITTLDGHFLEGQKIGAHTLDSLCRKGYIVLYDQSAWAKYQLSDKGKMALQELNGTPRP